MKILIFWGDCGREKKNPESQSSTPDFVFTEEIVGGNANASMF
jgi:hypothetical protein